LFVFDTGGVRDNQIILERTNPFFPPEIFVTARSRFCGGDHCIFAGELGGLTEFDTHIIKYLAE